MYGSWVRIPAGSQKNATQTSGIFLSLKLGLGPKGSIRRRLRVVLGECGAEPIPAGSQKKSQRKLGLFLFPLGPNPGLRTPKAFLLGVVHLYKKINYTLRYCVIYTRFATFSFSIIN